MRSVETVLLLVALATVVATFARRWRLPAPSVLVAAGVVVGLLPGVPAVEASPELVSLVVLPPLLFAAGEELPWRDLRQVWRPVTVLALGLVVVSAAAVGAVTVALTPISPGMAFVLGAVLASTDPVAVTALGRRLALPPRVAALVQAESLFNDATSLLLFRVALSVAVAGGAVGWAGTLGTFALLAGGGLAAGGLVAGGAYLVRRRTRDPVLETVICLITPYAAYLLAEAVGASGVTAVVVAGLVLGTQAGRLTTARIRLQLGAVFDTVVFLLESAVFSLIGLQLPVLVERLSASEARWPLHALAIAATLLVVRALWVFPLTALARRTLPGPRRLSWQVPAVVSWSGARGVVPLAAALSIPLALGEATRPGDRDLVLVLTTAVIVVTLVVQGLTLAPLVRRTGIALTPTAVHEQFTETRARVTRAALTHLEQLGEAESAPAFAVEQLRRSWTRRLRRVLVDEEREGAETGQLYLGLRRDLLAVESAELDRLHRAGEITDTTRRRVQHLLDLELAVLADDPVSGG